MLHSGYFIKGLSRFYLMFFKNQKLISGQPTEQAQNNW